MKGRLALQTGDDGVTEFQGSSKAVPNASISPGKVGDFLAPLDLARFQSSHLWSLKQAQDG
jgi:hypothetical protein